MDDVFILENNNYFLCSIALLCVVPIIEDKVVARITLIIRNSHVTTYSFIII